MLLPDEKGYFGSYGGRFVPETLVPALNELVEAYKEAKADAALSRGEAEDNLVLVSDFIKRLRHALDL